MMLNPINMQIKWICNQVMRKHPLHRRIAQEYMSILPTHATKMDETTKKLSLGVSNGDRTSLARAITLVESTKTEHREQAKLLLEDVLNRRRENNIKSNSFRIGITGPPGAGKSTFVEALGVLLLNQGHKVAVIAVDPSSVRTQGSILGDKTRMVELSKNQNAYVRPSPTRGILGGIAEHTNDVVLLCEAANFDIVLVETVGLGQSEIKVDDAVDMLLLVVPPAGGDELQGVKKGIMEVADLVVINKADGDLENAAKHAATEYMHAVQLMRRKREDWRTRVKRCSARTGFNIDTVWDIITQFRKSIEKTGELLRKREEQAVCWMWSDFQNQLTELAKKNDSVLKEADQLKDLLRDGHATPRGAAQKLLDAFLIAAKKG